MTTWAQTITIVVSTLVGVGTLMGMFWRALNARFDVRFEALGTRIDGAEQRLDAKIDALAKLTEAQLRPLQEDMALVKQRLFAPPAA